MNALSQILVSVKAPTTDVMSVHSNRQDKMPSSKRTLFNHQMHAEYKMIVRKKMKKPVALAVFWEISPEVAGGGKVKSAILFLHNLVHALARKVELICNRTKARARLMHLENSKISLLVCGWPGTKRSPLPVSDLIQRINLRLSQLTLPVALAKITHPRSNRDFPTINVFEMNCRNSAMSLSSNVLIECCNCHVESGDVVHVGNSSRCVSDKLAGLHESRKSSFSKPLNPLTVVESKPGIDSTQNLEVYMEEEWNFEELESMLVTPTPEFMAACEAIANEDISSVLAAVQDPTTGNYIILIHAPAQSLGGQEEPVLISTLEDRKYYGVFSTENVMAHYEKFKHDWNMPEDEVTDEMHDWMTSHIVKLFEQAARTEADSI